MSIIIRLQNLPWSANALDIRQYFHGLSIPEGGVHIVGGELGDAFIAFSTDEDARQAFNRSDGQIKGIQIKLMLSSRQEMQRVIEQARNQSMAAFMLPTATPQTPLPAAVPSVVPAPVPEVKQEGRDVDRNGDRRDKREKRRSRSKSREREREKKDKSKDKKDRKYRDRSRSRSRDRRDRRRRDRSRNRSRSRDRRRDRSPKRERSRDLGTGNQRATVVQEVWSTPNPVAPATTLNIVPPSDAPGLFGAYPLNLDPIAKRALEAKLGVSIQAPRLNGFPNANNPNFNLPIQQNLNMRPREPWLPSNHQQHMGNNFQNNDKSQQGPMGGQRSNFQNRRNDHQGGGNFDFKNQGPNRKPQFGNADDHNEVPVNACISMEPFYGSYGDLRRFFNGLSINYKGIKVINDEFGHKTGICFVQFRDSNAKNAALKMNGQKLNNIDVKIVSITDQVFEEAVDRYNPRMDPNQGDESHNNKFARHRNISKYFNNAAASEPQIKEFTCLKIEDLPTYVKEQDILHIFSQHPLISLHLNNRPRGGSVAYVKFGGQDIARQALEEKSHHVISGKPVTVKPCKDEEFEKISGEQSVTLNESNPVIAPTDCLSLTNLPPKTTDRDISDFFSDIGVIPLNIHLMGNHMGFTGQVYCEFSSNDEAKKALSKNGATLGPNVINVVPILRSEMTKILDNVVLLSDDKNDAEKVEEAPVINVPNATTNEPPEKLQIHQNIIIPPSFPPLMSPQGVRPLMNERPMMPMMRGRMGHRGPRFGGRGRGGGHRFNHPNFQGSTQENFEDRPGCTVFMDNVPYKAGTDEILDFFDGYNCTNNVSRRYNANNTPSAEAKVTFRNPEDAFQAVNELQGKKIWERTIYLRQV